jgi:hypothetical protein
MTADEYLYSILRREAVDNSPTSPIRTVVQPMLNEWVGFYLRSMKLA